jgi:hypothetical protein
MIKYKQLYISLRNEISKYNAKQSHDIITNNNGLPNIKRFLPYQLKIIPWPHARFGDVPRAVPLPSLRAVLLADQGKLTGTSQPNARGTLLPP